MVTTSLIIIKMVPPGMNPPLIMIHGNTLNHVPDSYRRYLERAFMAAFDLRGTPVKVLFKQQGRNPFAGRGKKG